MNHSIIRTLAFLSLFLLNFNISFANEPEKKEKFNAGELIIEHITDNHYWHVVGDVSIPLPVIIYQPGKGVEMFSSSRFEHGHVAYNGYRLDEKNHIEAEDGSKLYDLSITKNVASLLVAVGLMLLVFISIARRYSQNKNSAPKGLQSW